MKDFAIKVENLSKEYRLGKRDINSFRESVLHFFNKKEQNHFWALKDVNFEIEKGQAVGIIGSNGAGKSTLLKLLSKITFPTEGRIELTGRVSSLLEVGTGFHPELTGSENITLNGTILGMTHREIRAKFDEIVAFSGVEQFLSTPIKHYSSGMKVRLAFSVAAHLEPEILIIDEVLAVGDAEFQKKCLGKMDDVTKMGRTVLFVSHNMNAIELFCQRIIHLQSGKIVNDTMDVASGINHYLSSGDHAQMEWKNSKPHEKKSDYFRIERFGISSPNSGVSRVDSSFVEIEGEILQSDFAIEMGYVLTTIDGKTVFHTFFYDGYEGNPPVFKKGPFKLSSQLPTEILNENEYQVTLIAGLRNIGWIYAPNGQNVTLTFALTGILSKSPLWVKRREGLIAPVIKWTLSN